MVKETLKIGMIIIALLIIFLGLSTREWIKYLEGTSYMKKVIEIIILAIGLAISLYLGGYLLFGGAIQVINGIQNSVPIDIILGIIKVAFCELSAIPFIFTVAVVIMIDED